MGTGRQDPSPSWGDPDKYRGGTRGRAVRFPGVCCLGPGKSGFPAPTPREAGDFAVMVTAKGSRGRRRAHVRSPAALPSSTLRTQHPAALYSVYPRWGEREGGRALWGRGRGRPGDGAGEADPPLPSPPIPSGSTGGVEVWPPPSPGSPGYRPVRSWLQTLASRMPGVDERCIME